MGEFPEPTKEKCEMDFKHDWNLVIFAAALAVLFALISGANALAGDYLCTGSLGAIGVGNLRVPETATCILNGTRVSGNITVATNATLYAYKVQVNGNLKADKAVRVNIYAGSVVGGDIQITHSGAAEIQSVEIHNNLAFKENIQYLKTAGNTIGGDLQASNNTGGMNITGNTIGNNLQCKGNYPAPTGSGNIVEGNLEAQCISFGVDPPPVPTSPPPVPTNTPTVPTNTPAIPTGTPVVATATPTVTATATPTVAAIDQEAPTVQWIGPVHAGERYDVHEGDQVLLEADASDNVGIGTVRFLRWDAVNEQYVTLGSLVQPPFRLQISGSILNPDWNQVFVIASDQARNSSDYPYIWLYKLVEGGGLRDYQVYLPFTGK